MELNPKKEGKKEIDGNYVGAILIPGVISRPSKKGKKLHEK